MVKEIGGGGLVSFDTGGGPKQLQTYNVGDDVLYCVTSGDVPGDKIVGQVRAGKVVAVTRAGNTDIEGQPRDTYQLVLFLDLNDADTAGVMMSWTASQVLVSDQPVPEEGKIYAGDGMIG